MNTNCHQIDQVISLALKRDNEIFSYPDHKDQSGKLVVWMYNPLTASLKSEIDFLNLKLRHWDFNGAPHNPAASGYTCDECNVVLAFPCGRTPRTT